MKLCVEREMYQCTIISQLFWWGGKTMKIFECLINILVKMHANHVKLKEKVRSFTIHYTQQLNIVQMTAIVSNLSFVSTPRLHR